MSEEFRARSFDPPRERPAPTTFLATPVGGVEQRVELRRDTLIVVVKPHCDGCHSFIFGDLSAFSDVDVLLLSREAPTSDEWSSSARDILVAPALLDELHVSSAPFYVVISPTRQRVVTEGIAFDPAQVAAEMASIPS